MTQSDGGIAADREFWIVVAFCTLGFAATMYIFERLLLLLDSTMVWDDVKAANRGGLSATPGGFSDAYEAARPLPH
jgi:hypothetical protein